MQGVRIHFSSIRTESGEGGNSIHDEAVIQQVLQGNHEAFRTLVKRYRQYLFQVVYSVLRDAGDAEDVTQEAFTQIYFSLPRYRHQGLKTWMTRIAVNKAIDFRRRAVKKREQPVDTFEEAWPETMPSADVEHSVIRKEYNAYVMKRLQELPENYRDVVCAYYIEDKSYQEIAEEMGIALKSVESRLYRAKKWIHKHWKEEDFR